MELLLLTRRDPLKNRLAVPSPPQTLSQDLEENAAIKLYHRQKIFSHRHNFFPHIDTKIFHIDIKFFANFLIFLEIF